MGAGEESRLPLFRGAFLAPPLGPCYPWAVDLTNAEWRSLLRLSGEMGELLDESPAYAAEHALESLIRLTGADDAVLVFSAHVHPETAATDPLAGWRPVHSIYRRRSARRARLMREWFSDPARVFDSKSTRLQARRAGADRTLLGSELLEDRQWVREPMFGEVLDPLGLRHRLYGGIAEGGLDICLLLDRGPDAGDFGERERLLLSEGLPRVRWFFRRLARDFGLHTASSASLTPRERETLDMLRGGSSEKVIARAMGLSVHTVHGYVKSLYRKLGVNSRAELLARYPVDRIRWTTRTHTAARFDSGVRFTLHVLPPPAGPAAD